MEERLKSHIVDGEKVGLEDNLKLALESHPALDIINNILLDGMKTVGELFGSGQMQLPFVLQSAEVMKAAVRFLEPFMEKKGGATAKGTMVLATVKGDVHDIGKNLVDIILTNNGYKRRQPRHQAARRGDSPSRGRAQGRRRRHVRASGQVHSHHAREP